MCLRQIVQYDAYLEYLRENPEEVDSLVKDMLISVTDFFRDAEAWNELRELAIRPMVAKASTDETIRVWTPGCATGEEPYSLAILFFEELAEAKKSCPLQIFASDIDKDALAYARNGEYPATIEADVSAARLKQFFVRMGNTQQYRINKQLRESLVFAEQNLISDPPFSKLHLICCRNLLIYLKPDTQEKLISLFHFALREDGYLFLGSAETVGQHANLFQTLNKRWRIYRRVGALSPNKLAFPVVAVPRREFGIAAPALAERREDRLAKLANQWLMDYLAPAAVIVDDGWDILYISGDVDKYLQFTAGVPDLNLLEKARRGLRAKLRSAVHRANKEQRMVNVGARVYRHGQYHDLRLVVRRLPTSEDDRSLTMIIFQDAESQETASKIPTSKSSSRRRSTPDKSMDVTFGALADDEELDDHDIIRQLEDELAATRDDLQATTEQFESSNEEFKAANEEVMSINEELQSTVEELETSKEELQSLNEELSTVNNQLATKVEELESKHADLENLLVATNIATICLDTDMKVRWFTPAATQVIRLQESDKGRPISDIAHDFVQGDLPATVALVLEELTTIDDEVNCRDGRAFLRRVFPYRVEDHRIGGVVAAFVDVTALKQAHDSLMLSEARLRKVVENEAVGILFVNHAGEIEDANTSFLRMSGYSNDDIASNQLSMRSLVFAQFENEVVSQLSTLTETGWIGPFEAQFRRQDRSEIWLLLAGSRLDSEQAAIFCVDISDRKQAETDLASTTGQLEAEFQALNRLHELGMRLLADSNLEALLNEVLLAMLEITDAQMGYIQLLDEDGQESSILVSHGLSSDLVRHFQTVVFGRERDFAEKLSAGERLSEDLRTSRIFEGDERNVILSTGARAGNIAPLSSRNGKLLGAVTILWTHSHSSEDRQLRLLDLLARQAADLIERSQVEASLRESEQNLRALSASLDQQVKDRIAAMNVLHDITMVANEAKSTEAALQAALDRICEYNHWIVGHAWQRSEDGKELISTRIWSSHEQGSGKSDLIGFRESVEALRLPVDRGFPGSVVQSEMPMWIENISDFQEWVRTNPVTFELKSAIAFPIFVDERVVAVLEFFSDRAIVHEEKFMEIMPSVGIQLGHVFERRQLEREAAMIADREQRLFGQELHDGLSQQLAGMAMLAGSLAESLGSEDGPVAERAQKLLRAAEDAKQQARSLSKGLMPVEIEPGGLCPALEDLADRTAQQYGVACNFESNGGLPQTDSFAAMHLYRIAREAVHNAVKHSGAKKIWIRFGGDSTTWLTVRDDGKGFDATKQNDGDGLRLMKHRASLIDANLDILSEPGNGTMITCQAAF